MWIRRRRGRNECPVRAILSILGAVPGWRGRFVARYRLVFRDSGARLPYEARSDMTSKNALVAIAGALTLMAALTTPVRTQAGKGLTDPNIAGERDLLALPSMTPTIVKAMLEKRPFMSALELHAFLL